MGRAARVCIHMVCACDVHDLRLDGEQVADAAGRRRGRACPGGARCAARGAGGRSRRPSISTTTSAVSSMLAGLHAVGAEPERDRGPERDAHVADAAGQGVGAEQPHGGLEERVAALLEQPGAGAGSGRRRPGSAGPGSRRGTRRRRPCRPSSARGCGGCPSGARGWAAERWPPRREDDPGERQVDRGHDREDQERGQRGDEELGQVLAEVDLELLHALDDREDDVAGAGLGEVGGTERGDLRVERARSRAWTAPRCGARPWCARTRAGRAAR